MIENAMQSIDQLKTNNWVLAILALLPAIVLCIYIYIKDRVEKEPILLLLGLLVLGAVSCFPAGELETMIAPLIDGIFLPFAEQVEEGGRIYNLLPEFWFNVYCAVDAFIGVALIEELCKWAVLVLITYKSKHFNCVFDGIIYAVFVSLGFAALENVMYAFSYGFDTVLIRAVTSIPGHMFFGIFMGIYYSLARLNRELKSTEQALAAKGKITVTHPYAGGTRYMVQSLAMPILVHGFYDFCLFTDDTFFTIVFYIFLLGMYIYCFARVRHFSKVDGGFSVYALGYVMKKYNLVFTKPQ